MAKDPVKVEAMLYGAFLDLWYTDQAYESRIEELKEELKEVQGHAKKTKKLLTQVETQYAELNNGRKPTPPKKELK